LAVDTIRGWYKTYSHSGCIKLLSRLGYEYHEPKGLPRVAYAEAQAEFIAM
jgi:hypothetical protein